MWCVCMCTCAVLHWLASDRGAFLTISAVTHVKLVGVAYGKRAHILSRIRAMSVLEHRTL